MITVACVLRSGGDYDSEYVERLRDGVAANLTSHRFVCLSDVGVACERIQLMHDWPGWWAKMELFRLPGPVLALDLDTVIVGDLSAVAAQAVRSFTMLADFYRPALPQSGVMAWPDDVRPIYEGFRRNAAEHMARYRGDGEYLAAVVGGDAARWQDVLPGQVVSRKVTATRNSDERIVCFHGQPRPRSVHWSVQ